MTMRWMIVLLCMIATGLAQEAPAGKKPGKLIYLRDYGTDDLGYCVVPEKEPAAGVVVLPDRRGFTPEFKSFCEKLAEQGYLVLGVDLFNGRVAKDDNEAEQMASSLQEKIFNKVVRTGLNFFEASPQMQMEKKMLIACGVSCDLTLKNLGREKGLLSVVLMDPPVAPEKELILELRVPLQLLLPSSSPMLPSLRAMEPELSTEKKNRFELRVVEGGAYLESIHAFFRRVLREAPTESLIEKIFD